VDFSLDLELCPGIPGIVIGFIISSFIGRHVPHFSSMAIEQLQTIRRNPSTKKYYRERGEKRMDELFSSWCLGRREDGN
jgi:hypothetical protein